MADRTDKPLDFRFDDRVSDGYDDVRRHPEAVSDDIAAALRRELKGATRVFEPGVGTGRIALPLARAGLDVIGADISKDMLDRLAAQPRPESGSLTLLACDVHSPPLPPGSVDAVICVHVLHLLEDWSGALVRFCELLAPGGCVILAQDWIDPDSVAGQIRMAFRKSAVALSDAITMPPMPHQFAATLIEQGLHADTDAPKTAAEWQTRLSVAQLLNQIRTKDDPESWVLPDPLLAKVMAHLDAWSADTIGGDLDAPQDVTRRFTYTVYRRPD